MNDEGLFCSEHWTEFLNYLIDEGRQDERAKCVAELEKIGMSDLIHAKIIETDEEGIVAINTLDLAIATLKHEAKTKEVE